MTEQVDVVVLGMGPGGEEVAGRLAQAGLAVVGIEGKLLGGECPYWGCVPSKMMIRAGNLLAEARRVPGMAGASTVSPDWGPVARRIRDEATDDWDDKVAVDRFVGKGGRFVRGWGRLDGPRRVVVGDDVYEAGRAVVVATGAKPWAPPIAGLAELGGRYWTNREAIETETVPASLVVLGGGAIGVELGQVFARFGAEVSIVEGGGPAGGGRGARVERAVAEVLRREGVTVRTSARITGVRHEGTPGNEGADGRFVVELEGDTPVTGQRLLVCTGPATRPRRAQREEHRCRRHRPGLPVDGRLRVTDGVWAVGDVTGVGAFTHVADVPGRHRRRGHPGQRPPGRRLPGAAARHLHRSRDRVGGDERSGGAPPGVAGAGRGTTRSRTRRGDGSTRPGTRGSSSSSRTASAACWWGRPRPGPPAGRCCRC